MLQESPLDIVSVSFSFEMQIDTTFSYHTAENWKPFPLLYRVYCTPWFRGYSTLFLGVIYIMWWASWFCVYPEGAARIITFHQQLDGADPPVGSDSEQEVFQAPKRKKNLLQLAAPKLSSLISSLWIQFADTHFYSSASYSPRKLWKRKYGASSIMVSDAFNEPPLDYLLSVSAL